MISRDDLMMILLEETYSQKVCYKFNINKKLLFHDDVILRSRLILLTLKIARYWYSRKEYPTLIYSQGQ